MISIGERVKRCIDDIKDEKDLFALEQILNAIDATAKAHYKKPDSSKIMFKKLIIEYSWVLELIGLRINIEKSTFGNFPFKDQSKEYNEPTFKDIIYHLRCGIVHGTKYNLHFHSQDTLYIAKNCLIFPRRLIYGLVGIVVFCNSNAKESTEDGYHLPIYDQNFMINEWWGMEDNIRSLFQDRIKNEPTIIVNIPYDSYQMSQKGSKRLK